MGLFTKKTAGAAEAAPAPKADPPPTPKSNGNTPTPAATQPPKPVAVKVQVASAAGKGPAKPASKAPKRDRQSDERRQKFHELKGVVHRKLVDQLDMTKLSADASDELREQVRQVVVALCEEEDTLLNLNERQRLAQEILDAFNGEGTAIQTRTNMHRMAEANKAFAHFAW